MASWETLISASFDLNFAFSAGTPALVSRPSENIPAIARPAILFEKPGGGWSRFLAVGDLFFPVNIAHVRFALISKGECFCPLESLSQLHPLDAVLGGEPNR
jgi:hypothetical protein